MRETKSGAGVGGQSVAAASAPLLSVLHRAAAAAAAVPAVSLFAEQSSLNIPQDKE